MAGDWIKMRGNLWDDPRVARLCELTDTQEAQIIGGLYWLWNTADQHTETGHLANLTLKQIDRKTGIPGFGAALAAIEWIEVTEAGLLLARSDSYGPIFIVGVDRLRPFASAWMKLRQFVFKRDGMRCVYCGAAGVALECDHITPVALGGRHELSNLATACRRCNRSKAAKPLSAWRPANGW